MNDKGVVAAAVRADANVGKCEEHGPTKIKSIYHALFDYEKLIQSCVDSWANEAMRLGASVLIDKTRDLIQKVLGFLWSQGEPKEQERYAKLQNLSPTLHPDIDYSEIVECIKVFVAYNKEYWNSFVNTFQKNTFLSATKDKVFEHFLGHIEFLLK